MHARLRRATLFLALATFAAGCSSDVATSAIADRSTASLTSQLDVAPGSLELYVGDTARLVATPTNPQGTIVAQKSVNWVSANPAVATVTAGGFVTAVGPGATQVIAVRGAHQTPVPVTVVAGGVIGPDGGSVSAAGNSISVTLPAGAVSEPTRVVLENVADPTAHPGIVPGSAWMVGQSGALAQPGVLELEIDASAVAAWLPPESMRIARLVNGEWELLPTELLAEANLVAAGARYLGAAGESSSLVFHRRRYRAPIIYWGGPYAVINPCTPVPAGSAGVSGSITASDCLFTVNSRRSDYYTTTIANGQAIEFTPTSTFPGLYGVKEATTDPKVGTVYGSVQLNRAMRVVGSGAPLQLFVSGVDGTALGTYSIAMTPAAQPYTCGRAHAVVPGATFSAGLDASTACQTTIQFSPCAECIGKPIRTHFWNVKLDAGVEYTIRLSNISGANFNPAFTIFIANAQGQLTVLRQSMPGSGAVREFKVTVPNTVYVFPEISSGMFVNGSWQTPSGSYTLSVTR